MKGSPMIERKAQKNDGGVDQHLAGITDEQRRTDCLSVLKLMKELTGDPAVMWGKAIVGFGNFNYRGKTTGGDWFPVGISVRKQNLVLYLHCELEKQGDLLEKLGKHGLDKTIR